MTRSPLIGPSVTGAGQRVGDGTALSGEVSAQKKKKKMKNTRSAFDFYHNLLIYSIGFTNIFYIHILRPPAPPPKSSTEYDYNSEFRFVDKTHNNGIEQ